ncbi:hypothetical protein BJ165DRAFT_1404672 [Panaeolus papilionaceus]|nr:hypothetical protein BJ165DRAFT_1404672 [Panaeolus papilionaceus]
MIRLTSRKDVDPNTIHRMVILPLAIDALQYLLLSLQDPLQPKGCGNSLYGAIKRLAPLESVQRSKDGPGLFNATQRLWTTLYRFLATPRTDEQLNEMMKKFSVCSCSYQLGVGLSGKFHREYNDIQQKREYMAKNGPFPVPAVDFAYSASACIEGSYTNFFIVYILGTLRNVLHPGQGPGHVSVTLIRKGQSKRWPNQLSDLIPFGPEELVKSFLQWNRYLDDPCVLRTAIPIFTTCGELVQQHVAELNVTQEMVFEPTKRFLDANLKVLLLGARDISPYTPWKEMIWRICDFCSYASWIQSPGFVAHCQFYHGREIQALQLCSIFCYLLEFVAEQQAHNPEVSFMEELALKSSDLGRYILHDICPEGPEHVKVLLHPLISHHHSHSSIEMAGDTLKRPGNIVALAMVKSRIQLRCAAAGCRQTLVHVGSSFKLCQGCSTVGYCGSECRAQDWKDPEYPHKAACPIISRILDCLGGWPKFRDRDTSDLNATSPETQTVWKLTHLVEEMIEDGSLPEEELDFMRWWATRLLQAWRPPSAAELPVPEQLPGYDNYDEILDTIAARPGFRGPLPCFIPNEEIEEEPDAPCNC